MNDYFTSLIRTYVPLIVGAAVSWLMLHGINPSLTTSQMSAVVTTFTALVVGLYYTIVRLLEHTLSPKFGWLLGLAKVPSYSTPSAAPAAPVRSGPTATTPPSGE